jgi:hypothetical protein
MPLDDREQRILAEIERQFYAEDPDLAHAVRNISRSVRYGLRLPVAGMAIGTLILVLSYRAMTLLALVGFAILVVSATGLVHGIRARRVHANDQQEENSAPRPSRFKRGWPFRRS